MQQKNKNKITIDLHRKTLPYTAAIQMKSGK